jgi:hypothetical protein
MALGPGFYNEADQKLYSEGSLFLPQEKYRLSLGNNNQVNKLDFNNLSNSGIMSQAQVPYIYPPINQGGGGGGDGPPGPDDEDDDSGYSGITGYDSLGNPISNYTSPIDALKTSFAFMTNPFGYLGYKGYQAYKDKKAKKELQDFYNSTEAKTVQDMARDNKASNTGGYQAGYGGDFMDGPSGAGRGNAPSDKGGSDTMGSHADGGRVGYFYGGLASIL